VIALPPTLEGVVQVSFTLPTPATADTAVGALGALTSGGPGVTGEVGEDAGPAPELLTATTVNVCDICCRLAQVVPFAGAGTIMAAGLGQGALGRYGLDENTS
jgi:hypothetical protein